MVQPIEADMWLDYFPQIHCGFNGNAWLNRLKGNNDTGASVAVIQRKHSDWYEN